MELGIYPFPVDRENRYVIISSTGYFVVPWNVRCVYVSMIGGGGGGGNANDNNGTNVPIIAGGGGAGIEVFNYPVDVIPRKRILVVIGAAGGASASGGTSSFGNYFSVAGGEAGGNADSITKNGNGGRRGGLPGTIYDGAAAYSGNGGSGWMGWGGVGVDGNTVNGINGNAGSGYGSGGSGAADKNIAAGNSRTGGVGTKGLCIVRW
jgi:hypothetical protein